MRKTHRQRKNDEMVSWLIEHLLEIISLLLGAVGIENIASFYNSLHNMWRAYPAETVITCLISLIAVAIVRAVLKIVISRIKSRSDVNELDALKTQNQPDAQLDLQAARERHAGKMLSKLDEDKLGLVGIALRKGSIDEHFERANRAYLVENGILVKVEPSAIEAFPSYTVSATAASCLDSDDALKERALAEGERLIEKIDSRSKKAKLDIELDQFKMRLKALNEHQRVTVIRTFFAGNDGYIPASDEEKRLAASVSSDSTLRLILQYDVSSRKFFLLDEVQPMFEELGYSTIAKAVRDSMEAEMASTINRAEKLK